MYLILITGSLDNIKSSTSGYCFHLESGVFSWCSKKQEIVAQSTIEAEFIVAIVGSQNIFVSNGMSTILTC